MYQHLNISDSARNGSIVHLRYLIRRLNGQSRCFVLSSEERFLLRTLCEQEILRRKFNEERAESIKLEEGIDLSVLENLDTFTPPSRKRLSKRKLEEF